ncbi:hypothetical protein GCM10022410_04670 [Amphibacillus indicireducens]|uniref:Uncharacterized protein n=1 Tax=Amphibacillus indicireducens TaxID=1076330 RepID=A0ABP7V806_9BACI
MLVGSVGVIVILYLNKDIIFTERDGGPITLRFLWDFLVLIAILIIEIIKANIDVAKVVLKRDMPINPIFVTTPVNPKKDFNQVLYGNLITLTPGTLTVDMTEDGYFVHALNGNFGEGMEGSTLEVQVLKLEEKK